MKTWRVVLVAAVIAAAVGGCMSYVAGQHNPQGEFSNPAGELSLRLLFTKVFAWYFVPVFVGALALGLAFARGKSTDDV
ncbi:MAG TPA: hypothetical protein VFQ45_02155 [Longimicrobium sp.]|nr:hypothetical protein [Longimicrobium sp.]